MNFICTVSTIFLLFFSLTLSPSLPVVCMWREKERFFGERCVFLCVAIGCHYIALRFTLFYFSFARFFMCVKRNVHMVYMVK